MSHNGNGNGKNVLLDETMGAKSNVFAKFMKIPRTGIIYLATIAEQAGHNVRVVNENIRGMPVSDEQLLWADVLGISAVTATIEEGRRRAARYKQLRTDAELESKTVIGGIHASMLPDDVKDDFDQVVVGEAENVIRGILSGEITDKIVYSTRHENLDDIIIPDFKLVDDWQKIGIFPVMTSRGCPYGCTFCSVTAMFGRDYRACSPERVMQELSGLEKLFNERERWPLKLLFRRGIFFADDNFTENSKRTEEILDRMIQTGYNREMTCQVRTNIARRPDLVAKMRKAGFNTFYVGIESINPQSLKDMKKSQTVEDIKTFVRVCHDNDIGIFGMFILGTDADTIEGIELMNDFCREHEIDYAQFSIMTPLPGTKLYKELEAQGRLLHKEWDYYDGIHAVFQPKNMTAVELQQSMIKAYKEFYSLGNAARQAVKFAVNSVKAMFGKHSWPSCLQTKYQIAGTHITNEWIKSNQEYLNYLANDPKANTTFGESLT